MADNTYRDPKTTKIEDWKWRPLEQVKEELALKTVPDYIQKGFGGFMTEQAGRAQRGEMSPRDLIKAYTIAQSSIGRGGLSHGTATKTGMKLPNTGGEVRPEGAFSEWLGSSEGQDYLNAAERGEISHEAINALRGKFAPFGKQNDQAEKMAYAALTVPGMAEHLNKALTGPADEYRDFAEKLKGIAGAKSGFIGSLLGRGDLPTLDARQLNLHTTPAPVGVGSMMNRGKGKGAREAVDRLAARQSAMGFDIDPSLRPHYQHLAHHAVWDKASGTETTHDDLMRAMRGYAQGGDVNPTTEQMRQALAAAMPQKASEALGKHEGKTLMVTQADRTKVGGGYLGGPGFSSLQHTDPAYEGKAWGVMTPGMASTILGANKRVPKNEALWSTLIGTPEQHSSNQMVFNKLVRDFRRAAKAGLLTPELHSQINDVLASKADKEGKPFFGEGSNIMDPKTIKAADTFAKRRIIADLIGGVGVGGKKSQISGYDKLMRATTEPGLHDVPTHAIGPRLFGLSGETSSRPDLHPAFPQMLHGEDYGQTFRPVPKEVMLRDYMKKFMEEKKRKPGYMDLTLGYSPTQHLSEEFLSHLQKRGYAAGGEISQDEMLAHVMLHKASGGAVQPDNSDGTSTDRGYYEGGPADNAGTDMLQYRAAGGSIRPSNVGVEEAPNMPVKLYMPPGDRSQGGMPVGGVDFQPLQEGQQMLPGQPGQPGPGGLPAQAGPGGPPPANVPPPGGQPPGGLGQAMPAMGGAPQGMPPTGGAGAPTGPSNILSMTRQGQAMQAMRPPPPGMRPSMPRMAAGGSVSSIGLTERPL